MNTARPRFTARSRAFQAPLVARDPDERHRTATPLELLFDLVIVVAVARGAAGLHHALSAGHVGDGVLTYAMVFFGIWWAWVNFTWFASAYDNDDVIYRLLVLVQLTGALVFSAGIPTFEQGDRTIATAGYVIMRLALVTLWLRASRADPQRRWCTRRYAGGVLSAQIGWVLFLFAPQAAQVIGFAALALIELLIPAWAERAAPTTWHPHHIAERYGLFTIIALGESILATSIAVESVSATGVDIASLWPVFAGGLLIAFTCWWLYFDYMGHEQLTSLRAAFLWSYVHYLVFASVAALGAGLSVEVDRATGRSAVSATLAGAAMAVPVAIYVACVWLLHARAVRNVLVHVLTAAVILAVLAAPFTPQPVLVVGLVTAAFVGIKIAVGARAVPEPVG